MFSQAQAALVTHFDEARKADREAGTTKGELIPELVCPYGDELLDLSRLGNLAPCLLIEVTSPDLQAVTPGGDVTTGTLPFDVICVARNAHSGKAKHSDAVALMTWAFRHMQGYLMTLDDGTVAEWSAVRARRVLRSKTLAGYALTPLFHYA